MSNQSPCIILPTKKRKTTTLGILFFPVLLFVSVQFCDAVAPVTDEGSEGKNQCPSKCTCSPNSTLDVEGDDRNGKPLRGVFVECSYRQLKFISRLHLNTLLPSDTISLVLRGNKFTSIPSSAFKHLTQLRFLDLSENEIKSIKGNAFDQLNQLQFLNLSGNRLESLRDSFWSGAENVKELDLRNNPLPYVLRGSFKSLSKLNKLDIGNGHLTCDCNIQWMIRWYKKQSVQLGPHTQCRYPLHRRGLHLTQIKRKSLKCEKLKSKWKPKEFSMKPSEGRRLVFPGDDMSINCSLTLPLQDAANIEGSPSLEWLHNANPLPLTNTSTRQFFQHRRDGKLEISLRLLKISSNDEGEWYCKAAVSASSKIISKSIILIMAEDPINNDPSTSFQLSNDLPSCQADEQNSLKGQLKWPKTKVGQAASVRCPISINGNNNDGEPTYASRYCHQNGSWSASISTDNCDFASSIVRQIRHLKLMGKRLDNRTLLNLTDQLAAAGTGLSDEIGAQEVSLIVNAIHTIPPVEATTQFKLRILSNVLSKPSRPILIHADRNYGISKLVLNSINELSSDSYSNSITPTTLSATTLNNQKNQSQNQPFSTTVTFCHTTFTLEHKNWLSVGRRPGGLTCNLGLQYSVRGPLSANPLLIAQSVDNDETRVASIQSILIGQGGILSSKLTNFIANTSVIGIRIRDVMKGLQLSPTRTIRSPADTSPEDLSLNETHESQLEKQKTEPGISLVFPFNKLTDRMHLAVWNYSTSNWSTPHNLRTTCSVYLPTGWRVGDQGNGTWLCQGEFIPKLLAKYGEEKDWPFLLFTVLQDKQILDLLYRPVEPIRLESWIYAGSGCLAFCLLFSFAVYIAFKAKVGISRKLRHCLLNTWLVTSVLCMIFAMGINQTEPEWLCFILSSSLHIFLNSSFLWHLMTIRTIQRKLWKSEHPSKNEDDDFVSEGQGPILSLYFLGYGLPSMFIGFALAIKTKDFTAAKNYCFIVPGGLQLGSLVIPSAIILLISIILLIIAYCSVNEGTTAKQQPPQLLLHNSSQFDDPSQCLVSSPPRNPNGIEAANNVNGDGGRVSTVSSSLIDTNGSHLNQLRWAGASLCIHTIGVVLAYLYVSQPAWQFSSVSSARSVVANDNDNNHSNSSNSLSTMTIIRVTIGGLYSAMLVAQSYVTFYGHVLSRANFLVPLCSCWQQKAGRKRRDNRPRWTAAAEHQRRRQDGIANGGQGQGTHNLLLLQQTQQNQVQSNGNLVYLSQLSDHYNNGYYPHNIVHEPVVGSSSQQPRNNQIQHNIHRKNVGVGVEAGSNNNNHNNPNNSVLTLSEEENHLSTSSLNQVNFVINPEKERYMKNLARKYHRKQRALEDDSYKSAGNNSSLLLPSDGLQSEIILEVEEEMSNGSQSYHAGLSYHQINRISPIQYPPAIVQKWDSQSSVTIPNCRGSSRGSDLNNSRTMMDESVM